MFRTFLTMALFGLFLTTNSMSAFAGAPMDENAFKKLLADNSPWGVTWEEIGGKFRTGTHKLQITRANDGTLAGVLLRESGEQFSSLEKVTVMKNEKGENCLTFTSPWVKRDYHYCLEKDGNLKGTYKGVTSGGHRFGGNAVAKPNKR